MVNKHQGIALGIAALSAVDRLKSERDTAQARIKELEEWRRTVSEGLGFDCAAGIEWPASEIVSDATRLYTLQEADKKELEAKLQNARAILIDTAANLRRMSGDEFAECDKGRLDIVIGRIDAAIGAEGGDERISP